MTSSRSEARPRSRAPGRRLIGSALLCCLLAACRSLGPSPPAVRPAATALQQLQVDLDRLLASPALAQALWGVHVRSIDSDEILYTAGARKLLMPASALKLVTLAVAADVLGWDFAYHTRVLAAGPIVSGRLDGDLVVVGSGDPSIDDWDGAATALFQTWGGQLRARGVRAVAGRVVGDDRAFEDEPLGPGWAWDDLAASFATGAGALQFNQNTARLEIAPGARTGEPAIVRELTPAGVTGLRNLLTTGPPGTESRILARRPPGHGALVLRGSVPAGSVPSYLNVSVDNPTRYFARALRRALIENGVQVAGPAVAIDDTAAPDLAVAELLIVHRSPTLATLARTMMWHSQNLYAETLLRTLGRDGGQAAVEAGRAAVRERLEAWGVDPQSVLLADGSGLSRYNLATSEALTAVLLHAFRDQRLRDPFLSALPTAGRSGTIARRMAGTAADGNARAKTGSFSNARSLAGYVWTADGEGLAFAVTANNFGAEARAVDAIIDAVVVRLAEFSRGRPDPD